MKHDKSEPRLHISRRAFLGGIGVAGAAVAVGSVALPHAGADSLPNQPGGGTGLIPYFGTNQGGVTTPQQDRLHMAAFDLTTNSVDDVKALLRSWSAAAAMWTQNQPSGSVIGTGEAPPVDTGEQIGAKSSRLTITFGFGPGLFTKDGKDRFGLAKSKPANFAQVPAFANDDLDPSMSDGDVVVQACGDDQQVLFHVIHNLTRMARGAAVVRWAQVGFGKTSATTNASDTGRNLMGMKDGTDNLDVNDAKLMQNNVWVASGDGPAWLVNGSYMVTRRIRMLLPVWDRSALNDQEATIGRFKGSGAPLTGANEHDTPDFSAKDSSGNAVIPLDAHMRLAHPDNNNGIRILRRGFGFTDGTDSVTGELDAGLFFVAYMKSITNQFIPLQTHLASMDALNEYIKHVSSAVFAVPSGATQGSYPGAALFGD